MINMEKEYCYECDTFSTYEIKEEETAFEVRGITFYPVIKKAYCLNCGKPIFVESIEKENDRIVYDMYKKFVGLLTSQEITEIRAKYNLTQKGLAQLLDVGEKDITRYENGAIQSKVIDNMLRLIQNPIMHNLYCFYLNKIKSISTRKRMRNAADKYEQMKVDNIGDFIKVRFLDPNNLTSKEISNATNISIKLIDDILENKARINLEISAKLGAFFGLSATYLVNMQNEIDYINEKERIANEVREIVPAIRNF